MGGLVESLVGGDKASTSTGNSGWQSGAWTPEMAGQYNDTIQSIINGGVPTSPSHVGLNQGQLDAINQMGSGGATGQYYASVLGGAGQADRYQGLQDLNTASAAQSAKALDKSFLNIQGGATQAGTSGGSRQSLAQGIAASDAQTNLAAIQAQQNQQFMQNEQNIMTNAANQLQGIAKDSFTGSSIMQDDEKQKVLAEWKDKYGQTAAGKMEFLLGLANSASGVAGGTQTGNQNTNNTNQGFMGWFS
ncbi:hypothetical protein [Enterovibrio calviensis]|uniref:hypothetical protein n=1 Tax=Enterovibrio calviensis TaxID=91359 RepID=UPI0004826E17|nr:hypothetical protein [Enterovibrio calviensis]